MSEETKDQEVAGEASAVAESAAPAAAEPRQEPISIELEDLTEEGRKKLEEALHRPIEEIPATLLKKDKHPGSILHLTYQVSRTDYDAEQARLLRDLQKEAVLPGYRKGKVPLKLLQIRLGEDTKRDTIRSVATNVLRQENIKESLKLTVKPSIVEYAVPENVEEPVSFEVEAEVEPTVEVSQYKGLSVEVEIHPVTDEAVAQRLEAMRRENAVVENAPEGAEVLAEDTLTLDSEVFGEQGQKMENMSKTGWSVYNITEQLPAAVAELILGKKVEETVEARVENKTTNRRGHEVVHEDTWKVTVKEIKRSRLPELDDEFAKDLGDYATLEDLKTKIRADLAEAETQREQNEAVGHIYHKLIELNPLDVPHSLVSAQAYQLIMRDRDQLARYGMRLEHVIHDPTQYMVEQENNAGEMVKIGLLLDEIAKKEELTVSDEDVDKEIEKLAEQQGRKPLAVRARLEASRQLEPFREQVKRQKLNDFLIANNTVEKVEAKPQPEPVPEVEAQPAAEGEAKSEEAPQA